MIAGSLRQQRARLNDTDLVLEPKPVHIMNLIDAVRRVADEV
jgi:hypothetical protein